MKISYIYILQVRSVACCVAIRQIGCPMEVKGQAHFIQGISFIIHKRIKYRWAHGALGGSHLGPIKRKRKIVVEKNVRKANLHFFRPFLRSILSTFMGPLLCLPTYDKIRIIPLIKLFKRKCSFIFFILRT